MQDDHLPWTTIHSIVFIFSGVAVVVTESGFEIFSGFVPTEIEGIEKLMKEEGILQK